MHWVFVMQWGVGLETDVEPNPPIFPDPGKGIAISVGPDPRRGRVVMLGPVPSLINRNMIDAFILPEEVPSG